MTIREEFEYLKTELSIQLTDATVMCNLDFPFDLKIPQEEEDRYFVRGTQTRLATKRTIIILENTYKKVSLFPSSDTPDIFVEVVDGILEDYKKDVMQAYLIESWRFQEDTFETFSEYIDTLVERIKEASKYYVEVLRKLRPEDVEKEIAAKDKNKNDSKPLL